MYPLIRLVHEIPQKNQHGIATNAPAIYKPVSKHRCIDAACARLRDDEPRESMRKGRPFVVSLRRKLGDSILQLAVDKEEKQW